MIFVPEHRTAVPLPGHFGSRLKQLRGSSLCVCASIASRTRSAMPCACSESRYGEVVAHEQTHEMPFPMHLIMVEEFLTMPGGEPPSHQELMAEGKLVVWFAGITALFMSHPWCGFEHPDKHGDKIAILQRCLRGVFDGSVVVEGDVKTQLLGGSDKLSAKQRRAIKEGALFFDWFAIPQLTSRMAGVNESAGGIGELKNNAFLAVQSIPAYVRV